jgi:hypothetical protein
MKLYYPKDHYDFKQRRQLFPLLKPFFKPLGFSDEERKSVYGLSKEDFNFVDRISESNIAILTMSWLYYNVTDQKEKAIDFIKKANNLNIPVLVLIPGDNGMDVPKGLNIIVLRAQGYKSKLNERHYCMPVFINDPLKLYYNSTEVAARTYEKRPVVGFCGQANKSRIEALKDIFKTTIKNVFYYMKIRRQTPHALMAPKYLRAKLVYKILNDERVNSNFIIRKKYRAGVNSNEQKDKHKTTLEFFDNILHSDYVLCVRGAGNFSVRLYETLAMGRIPVFVNTDCMLPLSNEVEWKDHVVWVEYNERNRIIEKVEDYHNKLSETELNNQFEKNRKLWETKLQLKPYFEELLNSIN